MREPPELPPQWSAWLSAKSRRDFMKGAGRFAVASAMSSSLLQFLEACGPGSNQVSSTNIKPVKGGHLTEGFANYEPVMNSLRGDGVSEIAIGNMFDGLLGFSPHGDLIPLLAQSLPTVSSDSTTYTFKLRPNIKWSDNTPLTSDDVVFTYRLFYDPAFAAVQSPFRGELQRVIANVAAPNPATVVITLTGPNAPFLINHGRHYILPKHVLGSLSPTAINTAPFHSAPSAVSGPFKFVELVKGDHLTLARNDSCYRGAPYLDTWVLKQSGNAADLLAMLQTGEVDVARYFNYGALSTIQSAPNLVADIFPSANGTRYVYQMDPTKPAGKIFSDPVVRQALGYAVDRDGIVNAIYFKVGAQVLYTQLPIISWAYNPNPNPKYTYDPKKAAAMLDSAGWTLGPSGVREKGGVQMQFTITTQVGSTQWTNTAQVLQQNWKAIGVNAQTRIIPFSQLLADYVTTRNFDVTMYAIDAYPDPDLTPYFASFNTAFGGQNGGDYKNPAIDQLLAQADVTLDLNARKQLYFKIQDVLNQDAPSIPIIGGHSLWVRNKRVVNYTYPQFFGQPTFAAQRAQINQVFVSDGK
jgi:peptide/nickel transport system substrate-binding protein